MHKSYFQLINLETEKTYFLFKIHQIALSTQKQIVRISRLNLSKANNDARNGEKLGKLEGEESIIIKFRFSIASKNAAIKGIKVT